MGSVLDQSPRGRGGRPDIRQFFPLIADPHFQGFAKPLATWIQKSIAEREHPLPLLDLQEDMASNVIRLVQQRRSFRAELAAARSHQQQEELNIAIAQSSRAIRMIADVADGMAWRALGYRRTAIRQLALKPQTGAMELGEAARVLTEAYRHARATGDLVIVNDLTNCLRYGDYTSVGSGTVSIGEVKSGTASARNRRSRRQKTNLNRILQNLNTGQIAVPRGALGRLFDLPVNGQSHALKVAELLRQMTTTGFVRGQVSNSVAVTIANITVVADKGIRSGTHDPFPGDSRIAFGSTLDFFGTWPSEVAPISIFPYDVQDRAALLTGNLSISSYCALDRVVDAFQLEGLQVSLPDHDELNRVQSLPPGERLIQALQAPVTVTKSGSPFRMRMPFVVMSRIAFEFLDERSLARLIAALFNTGPQPGNLAMAFANEHELWD